MRCPSCGHTNRAERLYCSECGSSLAPTCPSCQIQNTGECETMGEDIAGIAVHIGARVAAEASAGEVLVSSTVKDLVAGSGLEFEGRGSHRLKGVPDEWRLFKVRSCEGEPA
jgi:class 3 adenylate cyclase